MIITGDIFVLLGCIMGGTARNIELLIVAQTLIGLGTGFVFDAFAAVPEMLPNRWRALGAGLVEGGINVPWYVVPSYSNAPRYCKDKDADANHRAIGPL